LRGGGVLDLKFDSPSIAKNKVGISSTRLINIYIPDGYEKSGMRYPTIYWVGGYSDGSLHNYPKMLDDDIKNGKIAPVIVVFINTPEGTWFVNSDITGYWEDFLVKELVPYIDSNYRTVPKVGMRGIGGHSAGGFAAVMLPLLHQGIWGAVGTNDAAIWVPWEFIIDPEEIPEAFAPIKNALSSWLVSSRTAEFNTVLASKIDDYFKKDLETKTLWELASRISPNPNNQNGVDLPVTIDGKWVPEVREKWRDFSILESKAVEKYRNELSQLSLNITVVYKNPDFSTVACENDYFIELLKSSGIPVNRMEMPGNHGDYTDERFIALVENMLGGLNVVSVDSKGKVTTTWGNIKSNN
jgi:S-formylglutathione hydrolase